MIYKQEIEYGDYLIKKFFKDKSGKPFQATETQINMFLDIYLMRVDRVAVLGMTRYGKSETVSMGILLRSLVYKESFVIGANSKEIAQILMNKCIDHLSDNPIFERNLVLVDKSLTKKLKKKESKDEFTWINGGGIRTVTLGANTKKSEVEALIGEGTNRLILEEASAIPNNLVGMATRMLGDNPHDNFCLKLGNALYLSHFSDSCESKRYKVYRIHWKKALEEGRTTEEFVEEQRQSMTKRQFESMYECKFPDPEEIDAGGYFALFSRSDFTKKRKKHKGEKSLGFDPSEGSDENCAVVRSQTRADLVFNSHVSDLMAQANIMINLLNEHEIDPANCFPDDTGVGAGITDRAKEKGYYVQGVKWGSSSKDKRYANLKAENFFALQQWIAKGGYIEDEETINELLTIRWKKNSSEKIIIKSKQEYASEGIPSQNRADALALTFNQKTAPSIHVLEIEDDEEDDWDDDDW